MRIVSRFDDYYDGLRSIDRDDDPLYVRETRTLPFAGEGVSPSARTALREQVGVLWTEFTIPPMPAAIEGAERAVLGFCGRVWPCFRVFGSVVFDVDGVIDLARQHIGERSLREHAVAQLEEPRASAWTRDLGRGSWARFLDSARLDVGDAPFLAFNAPAVVVTDTFVEVNPRLRDWGFASRVDPYRAWQDLSVYLGNTLAANRTPPPRPIDDTLKAHAHGFDRQSFRNTKNRPRGNRRDW